MCDTIAFNNNVISTKELVYSNSPAGKLDESSSVRTMLVPLQQGFHCDSEACLPIGIDYLPAIAFEERIVGTMRFANSTAVAAPFACVPAINNFKNNVFIKASAFKQLPEFIEWNPHNNFVESFSFSGKSFEVFNRNVGIKPQSHFSYLLDKFTQSVPDKVELSGFEFNEFSSCFETALIGKGLQQSPAQHYLFSFNPDVFSEIYLFQDFSFGGKNGNSKAFAVDVYPENIFSLRQFGFGFGKIRNNLFAGSQSKSLALPATGNERGISLEVLVLSNRDCDSLSGVYPEFDKKVGFSVEGFAVARNIELYCDSLEGGSSAFYNIAFNVANNLGIERGVFLVC